MPSFCPRWRMLLFCTDERFHVKLFYIYFFPLVATIYRVSMYVRVRDADCSSFGCRMTMLSSRVLIVEWVLLPRCLRILCKYNIHSLDEDTDTDKDTHLSRFPLKWRRQTHVSVHEWGGEKEIIHFWFVIVFLLLLVNFCIYGLRERERKRERGSQRVVGSFESLIRNRYACAGYKGRTKLPLVYLIPRKVTNIILIW